MEDVYAVIDMKSFYASCECAARGLDLFSAPLVVADPEERTENTIVMSVTPFLKSHYHCSNVCRVKDLPKIPGLIYAKPRMRYYLEMSAKVVSIFLDFVDESDLHVYSVDESFLHLSPYLSLYGCNANELVSRIQKRIKEELGLVATCGMGPNMFLAKVCLDNEGKKKPPYRAYWGMEDVPTKLWKVRPITEIWGISSGIAGHLSRIGIRSMEELAKAEEALLKKEFGIMGLQLHDLANGIDRTNIQEKYVPQSRSLSNGQTLIRDYDLKGGRLLLREMGDELCFRLRAAHLKAGVVSVAVRYGGHGGGFSRQCRLNVPTDDNDLLYEAMRQLFDSYAEDLPLRGLYISYGGLLPYFSQQYTLFDDAAELEEKRRLHQAMDAIAGRYGKDAVLRATSLTEDSTVRIKHTQIGGHNA